eukprot:GHVU01118310.1.p1 GENE.GHVU01118310.1~~GHVU01118310.1.p1  ORF type:complete len:111 (-),score=3.81 GHVU01118310.1:668-1000(-)
MKTLFSPHNTFQWIALIPLLLAAGNVVFVTPPLLRNYVLCSSTGYMADPKAIRALDESISREDTKRLVLAPSVLNDESWQSSRTFITENYKLSPSGGLKQRCCTGNSSRT